VLDLSLKLIPEIYLGRRYMEVTGENRKYNI
jgi:hypothetical protein